MSLPDPCVETLCDSVAALSVRKYPNTVPIAIRRTQAHALWVHAQLPSATAETAAALEDLMCLFGSAQAQIDFFERFDPDTQLAALAAEQTARAAALTPPRAKAPRKSPAKGEKAGDCALQVRATRTSLEGRPALVDEAGTYYEPVTLARALA